MGGNSKMWWRRGMPGMPMVQRDIKRFSGGGDVLGGRAPLPSDRRFGRFAKSDEVAACLLLREYSDAMPLRHEAMIARNRRRLKIIFGLMIIWWIAGWLLLD